MLYCIVNEEIEELVLYSIFGAICTVKQIMLVSMMFLHQTLQNYRVTLFVVTFTSGDLC